jgi:hypothetical protein
MIFSLRSFSGKSREAFSFADFLVVLAALALLAAVALPMLTNARAANQKTDCINKLRQITQAIQNTAEENAGKLPDADPTARNPVWWFYKEQVKAYLGLRGPSSSADKIFACPSDRGYEEGKPFRLSAKFDYNSYVYNGVNLPGIPNVAGHTLNAIREPTSTLLVMEWTAHAPLSWHESRTGNKNHPFYNDARSVVGFVDGHVDFIPIYYDGINAAYTRDPIPGYAYKYSGD